MILVYASLLLGLLLLAYTRRGPVVLRGRGFLRFNIVFCLLALLIGRFGIADYEIVFLSILLIVPFLYRRAWLILQYDDTSFNDIVESTLRLVLAPFSKQGLVYTTSFAGQSAHIRLHSPLASVALLTFSGNWDHNKGTVITSLLSKKLTPIIPRIVIKLGGRHGKNN